MDLEQAILSAKLNMHALGHFNFSTLDTLHAIVDAARSVNVPVILGLSEGERDFVGLPEAVAIIDAIRHSTDHPIFLNADHTYTFEGVKRVIDAGVDSVIFDGAQLTLQENIALTKRCVEYARQQPKHILIEAEIGYIGTSSSLLDGIPENAAITPELMPSPQIIKDFVHSTGVNMIAPAVGNIHGVLKNAANPQLDLDLIRSISSQVDAHFVLHGGSGISNSDFVQAIKSGVRIIHINTHLRKAWREALFSSLTNSPDLISPYKILSGSKAAVQAIVEDYLKLFNS